MAKLILVFALLIASAYLAPQAHAQEEPSVLCSFIPMADTVDGIYIRNIDSGCIEGPVSIWTTEVVLQRDDDETRMLKIYIDPEKRDLAHVITASTFAALIIEGNLDNHTWHQVQPTAEPEQPDPFLQ